MKLRKYIKRFSSILLAATMIAVNLPDQPKVQAEEYPNEILFPISILDFRSDNLFFQYDNATFAFLKFADGKGFVQDSLETDPNSIYYGLPVYSEALVENLAKEVQWELKQNHNNAPVLNRPYLGLATDEYKGVNPLSVRNYIGNKKGYVVLNAVDTNYKQDYKGAGNISGLRINNYYTEIGNGAECRAADGSLKSGLGYNNGIVQNLGGPKNGYVTFHYFNEYGDGNFNIDIYPVTWEARKFTLSVNGNSYDLDAPGNYNSWDRPAQNPVTLTNVHLQDGDNTIMFTTCQKAAGDKWAPNLDRIEISTTDNEYILGNYNDSKTKYNVDRMINATGETGSDKISDYGWYDIRTCYDYAYFITANLFKAHPTLNVPYEDYNNLRFHKVEDTTAGGVNPGGGAAPEPFYEFAGDEHHTQDQYGLIYNANNKSIRNGSNADLKADDTKRTAAGEMFIADGVYDKDNNIELRDYPSIDPFLNDGKNVKHNFLYTVRTHSQFVYKAGSNQEFHFSGDDDVYVFINNTLLIDLGGAHTQLDGDFNLDELAKNPKYGLTNGDVVNFDFFYIERHSVASNFYAKMNFRLKSDTVTLDWPPEIEQMPQKEIPYGWVVDLNYKFSSERELTTNKNLTFTDNYGNTIGAQGFEFGPGISLKDSKQLVVNVYRSGNPVPETMIFNFADKTIFTPEEKLAVQQYFQNLELEKGDTVSLDGIIYDTSINPFNSYDATDDPKLHKMIFKPEAHYTMYMTMGVNSVNNIVGIDNDIELKPEQTVFIRMGEFKVSARFDNDTATNVQIKKKLYAFGNFTIYRQDDNREVYSNQFDIVNNKTQIIFTSDPGTDYGQPDSEIIYEDALPQGQYKLNMDVGALNGYDLSVEIVVTKPDGSKVDVEVAKGETKIVDGISYSFDTLFIDFAPEIVNNHWVYPEVEYILKAKRKVNPLKDLT